MYEQCIISTRSDKVYFIQNKRFVKIWRAICLHQSKFCSDFDVAQKNP